MPNNLERSTVIIKGVETSVFRRIEADPEKVKSILNTGGRVDLNSFFTAYDESHRPFWRDGISSQGKLAEEGDQRMTSHHSVLSKRFV